MASLTLPDCTGSPHWSDGLTWRQARRPLIRRVIRKKVTLDAAKRAILLYDFQVSNQTPEVLSELEVLLRLDAFDWPLEIIRREVGDLNIIRQEMVFLKIEHILFRILFKLGYIKYYT